MSANAQSVSSSKVGVTAGSAFIVAPSVSLSAVPTSIAVGDLNGDGKPDLVITKKGSGSVTVLLGDGSGGFAAGVDYPAGTSPGNVLVADINGDGKLDVVLTDSANGAIDVLPGNGDGTLGTASVFSAIANPSGVALGNFRGNGKIDLAVVASTGLATLLNDGNGNFSLVAPVSLGSLPLSLTAADVNGDGHDDLVLANQDGTLNVLLGDGSGHFRSLSALTVATLPLSSVVAGDFNKDGKLDLAVTQANSNVLTVLLGRGDGTFQAGAAYTVGNNPSAVIAADFNGDLVLDLIAVNQSANTFSVLLGKGDGTFASAVDFVAGDTPFAAVAADFNGDGYLDLAIASSQSASISVPLGKGDGTFKAARSYKAGLQRKAIAAGDLNGDGRSDLVVASFCGYSSSCTSNGSVAVFLTNADSTYTQGVTYALGSGPVAVALADLNGDKKLDLLALNRNDKTLTVRLGNGDGTFGDAQSYTLATHPRALFAGDFNGDSKVDLAIVSDCGQRVCTQAGGLDIWLGNGDGTLAESTSYPVGYSPVSVTGGNLRGTGHIDLIVANACGEDSTCKAQGTASVFFGDGTAKFTQSNEINIGSAPSAIALGNLFGNGQSLVVAQRSSDQIAVLATDGKGGFGAPVAYTVGSAPSALAVADINGDGLDDVAVANFTTSTVSVLDGSASGTLQSAVTYTVGTGPESIAAVTTSTGSVSSLVTANSSTSASLMGSDVSLLTRTSPMLVDPTSITVTPNPASSTVDGQVTISAQVSGGSGTPTGTVTFSYLVGGNPTALTDCVSASGILDGTGTGTCTTRLLPAGSDGLFATYSGDGSYNSFDSSATPVSISVARAATTTTVDSSNTSTNVNVSVTFTATVSPSPNPGADIVPISGTVNFQESSATIGTCSAQPVNFDIGSSTYTATCTTSALAAGTHSSIHAVYAGDSNYTGSTSSDKQQTVSALAATIGVTASPSNSTKIDVPVTFTAQLSAASLTPVVPAGKVAFTANSATISGCGAVTVNSSGAATCLASPTTLPVGTNMPISVAYTGDTNYTVAAAGTMSQTVAPADTTTTVTSSATSPTVDESVTFTATVAPTPVPLPANEVALSGTVTFVDSSTSTTICSGQAVTYNTGTGQATATCAYSALTASGHSITATYTSSDMYYNTSNGSVSQTVNKAATSTSLVFTSGTWQVNQQVVLTATVTASGGSATVPMSGAVTFADATSGGISACTTVPTITASGMTAACTATVLTGGAHSITATYNNSGSDTNYTSSFNATALASTATVADSSTTLTSLPASSWTVDQPVTFTATVKAPTGAVPISTAGTVSFTDNTTAIPNCTALPIAASGNTVQVQCTASALTGGSHTIKAVFSGDNNYNTSNDTMTQTVNKAASTVTPLDSSLNPSTLNNSVTLTATVNAPAGATIPLSTAGTVAFTDNGNPIASCISVSLPSAGTSVEVPCVTTALSGGNHTIVATYSGDTNYSGSNLSVLQAVSKAISTISFTSSSTSSIPNTSTVNQAVTLTASVGPTGKPVALTGPVTFKDNGNSVAGCVVNWSAATGQATCTTSSLSLGTHTIVANYPDDVSYIASSATVTQTVNQASTTLALTSSSTANTSTINQSVTFTAAITAIPAGGVALSGTVTFTDNGTAICTAVSPSVIGQATCTTSTLVLGSHSIVATYNGDGLDTNFSSSTNTLTQTVNPATTTVTFTSPANNSTSVVNSPVTILAQVAPTYGSGNFMGKMAFTSGSVILCASASVDTTSGAAICTASNLPAGTRVITAAYFNDPNYSGSSNSSLTIVVSKSSSTVTLTNPLNPSYVNNFGGAPVFTATVTPYNVTLNPTGTVTFTDTVSVNGVQTTTPLCTAYPMPNGIATCPPTSLPNGANIITATYTGDTNFTGSNGSLNQLVEDYSLGVLPADTTFAVSHGYTTSNDLFTPQTITVTPSSIQSFAGTLNIACTVAAKTTGSSPVLPGCLLAGTTKSTSTLAVASAGTQASVAVVIDATSASAGAYTVTVAGTDPTTGIQHSVTFPVTVRAASTMSITSGATSGNTSSVSLVLPAGVSLSSFTCPWVAGTGISGTPGVAPSTLYISCSFNPTTVASSTSVQTASVAVTVTTNSGTAVAGLARPTNLLVAGLFGIPIFGLIGILRGRRSFKSAIFRLLAIFAICAGVLQVLGCSGSFQKTTSTGTNLTTPPGTYFLQVQGVGSDGNKYQAVLQVNVTI